MNVNTHNAWLLCWIRQFVTGIYFIYHLFILWMNFFKIRFQVVSSEINKYLLLYDIKLF